MTEWRGILVVGELADGRVRRPTLELLAKGRELADRLGVRVTCVLIGHGASDAAQTAVHHGADKVLVSEAEHDGFQAKPLVAPLVRIIQAEHPEIVLLSATDIGRDLAPMLGARLQTGVASECVDLDVSEESRTLLSKRHIFGGQLVEVLVTPTARPQIASLRPGAAREGFPDESRYGSVEDVRVTLDPAARILSTKEGSAPELSSCDIVVVGGRGVPSDAWGELERLAKTLGGALGATRGAIHGGRAPPELQVGATGARVKPRLYLGFGVSGAFEHQLGIQGAEWVVAVNRDKEAPMFERADWALVGDATAIAKELRSILEDRA